MFAKNLAILALAAFFCTTACHKHDAEDTSGNPDSAAGKTGKAAYEVQKGTEKAAVETGKVTEKAAKEVGKVTEKAAKAIGHGVSSAAKDVHEGYKQASEEDKAKQ